METEITRQVTLDIDPEAAWDLLTRPDDVEGWLGEEVVLDPTPGAAGSVRDHDGTQRHLVVEEVEEGQRLTWRWWTDGDDHATSHVEITVAPSGTGALVTVIERPLPRSLDRTVMARAQAVALAAVDAWAHRLLHLEAMLLLAAARG